ncbi:MAG: hypothetical protein GX577_14280, partial [Leptolinea sp.]|nr:hypothetical protein [Leptolinea sp.]
MSPGLMPAWRQARSTEMRAASNANGSGRSCSARVSITTLLPATRTIGWGKFAGTNSRVVSKTAAAPSQYGPMSNRFSGSLII